MTALPMNAPLADDPATPAPQVADSGQPPSAAVDTRRGRGELDQRRLSNPWVRVRRQRNIVAGVLAGAFAIAVLALAAAGSGDSPADATVGAGPVRFTAGEPVDVLVGRRVEVFEPGGMSAFGRRVVERLGPATVVLGVGVGPLPAQTEIRYFARDDDVLARRVRHEIGVGAVLYSATPPKSTGARRVPTDIIVVLGQDARNE